MGDDRKKAWGKKVKKTSKAIASPLKAHPAPDGEPLNEPISMDEEWLSGGSGEEPTTDEA